MQDNAMDVVRLVFALRCASNVIFFLVSHAFLMRVRGVQHKTTIRNWPAAPDIMSWVCTTAAAAAPLCKTYALLLINKTTKENEKTKKKTRRRRVKFCVSLYPEPMGNTKRGMMVMEGVSNRQKETHKVFQFLISIKNRLYLVYLETWIP